MQTDQPANTNAYNLRPHPSGRAPLMVKSVTASVIGYAGPWFQLRWRIEDTRRIVVPPFAGKGRADDLWRRTCFEVFLRPDGGDAYVEFNFSPSEQWAAYDFDRYREAMRARPMEREPVCTWRPGRSFSIFDVAIPVAGLPSAPCSMQLTAVLDEDGDGGERSQSLWAIAHPSDRADFHDQACFTARLPAPNTL